MQKENRVSSPKIAKIREIISRHACMIYRKYKKEGKLELKIPGMGPNRIKEKIYEIRTQESKSGALSIEKYVKKG